MRKHVGVAILVAIAIAAPVRAHAADDWAPLFTTPFRQQIVNNVGTQSTPPTDTSATVLSVEGLNVGDLIMVRGQDLNDYLVRVVAITPQGTVPTSYAVAWDQPVPAHTAPNSIIRSSVSADPADMCPESLCLSTLVAPKQSAADSFGNVYVIDSINERVVVVDKHGSILWTLGGHARIYDDSQLTINPNPALDGDGNPLPFLVDQWGNACDNTPAPDWPTAGHEAWECPNDIQKLLGRFNDPLGIDVSEDGNTLIVSDRYNHRIQVLTRDDTNGIIVATPVHEGVSAPKFRGFALGGYGLAVGQMRNPTGVGFNRTTGQVIVSDLGDQQVDGNQRIEIFTPTGVDQYSVTAFGHAGPETPSSATDINFWDADDVKVDNSHNSATAGRIVVADTDNHRIQVFDPAGHYLFTAGSQQGALKGQFDTPAGVGIDDEGNIYVADTHNSRIQVLNPSVDGTTYTFGLEFGTEEGGGTPGLLPLLSPTGTAFTLGHLIITEQGGNRLQVVGRTSMEIASLTTTQTSLRVQQSGGDTLDGYIVIRNTGATALTDVTVAPPLASHQGQYLVPPTAASSTLAPAGSPDHSDTLTFHFRFQVTNTAATTLQFTVTASAFAGPVHVTASHPPFDTGLTVDPPAGPALLVGTVVLSTPRASNVAGVGDTITVTVPLTNIGNVQLSKVTTVLTPSAPDLLSAPTTSNTTIEPFAAGDTRNVTFSYVTQKTGVVTFTANVTAPDLPPDVTQPLRAGNEPSVTIVSDVTPPVISVGLTPSPNPLSLDGKHWYNGAPRTIDDHGHTVLTYPTIEVSATDDGLKALHWSMVTTSSQQQSDQSGTCSYANPSSVLPSMCVSNGANSLTWTRTLTAMQKRIVVAFWAEDQTGNGLPSDSALDPLQCLGMPSSASTITIGPITCVQVYVDTDAPTIIENAVTFTADNSAVHIGLTGGDPFSGSGVASMTSPQVFVRAPNGFAGDLVLSAEGASIVGEVTITDFAGNSATFSVPLPGRPTVRIDRTPPEAFNRVDPGALGKRCWTTINNQPASYFCTNKVYGTDNLPGFTTAAFAPVAVSRTKWADGKANADDDDDDPTNWDGDDAELHTYTFSDAYTPATGTTPEQNPNHVTLVEKVRQDGQEARVRVVSFQYQIGSDPSTVKPIVYPDRAYKKYEWSIDNDGDADDGLRMLNQKFELGHGQSYISVEAKFDSKKNITSIRRRGAGTSPLDVTAVGLILLRMRTTSDALVIDWDVNDPVPLPDIAAPVLTVPAPIVTEATSALGTMVAFNVTAFDGHDGLTPAFCTPISGSQFPLGTTTVSCNATDIAGNVGQKTFTVTVRDTTKPVLHGLADVTVTANQLGGAIVTFSVTAADTVDTSVSVTCTVASGSLFRVGTTLVACAGADDSGNVAMGTFHVTVKDTAAPLLTLPPNTPITVSTSSPSGANVTFTATAVDVVDGVRPVTCSPASGSKFKIGTTIVTCSASDLSGNTSTGTFSVVVKRN